MAYSQVLSAQLLQAQALESFGFQVKNTFIDDASPPAEACTPASRRACSVPAMSRLAADRESDEMELGVCSAPLCRLSPSSTASTRLSRGRIGSEVSSDEECSLFSSPASTCRGRDLSPASTCSTGTDSLTCRSIATLHSGLSWAEASATEIADVTSEEKVEEDSDSATELAALVAQECGFLRMVNQEFYEETSRVRKQRGVVKCVVFHCRGLPWAKRSKWLQPLLWSVAAVLKLRGCSTRMQSGELYAQLPGAATPGCNLIRLDFAAARE
jgi:hypothetical protein